MLQKSTITIPLGLGVNTKTDEKLVEQGQFNLVCENAVFEKVGAVKKRQSLEPLSSTYYKSLQAFGGGTGDYSQLDSPPTMAAALGESVLLRAENGSYLYKNGTDFILNDSQPIPEAKISVKKIFSADTTVKSTDCDYDSYEDIVAASFYEAGLSSVAATIRTSLVLYNRNTDTTITTPAVLEDVGAGSMTESRAGWTRLAGKSYYYHIYINASLSTLYVDIYDKNGQTYTTLSYPNMSANHAVAVCRNSDNATFYILAPTSTASTARFISISGSSQVTNATFAVNSNTWTTATARYDSVNSKINLIYDPARKVILSTVGVATTADASLAGISASGSYAYYPDEEKIIISGSSVWDYDVASDTQTLINYYSPCYSAPATISGISFSYMRPTQTSLPVGDGQSYLIIPTDTESAGTKIFGRFLSGQADQFASVPDQLGRSFVIDANTAVFSGTYFTQVNGSEVLQSGCLVFVEISQDHKSNSRSIIGTNLHIAGGVLGEFDGETLFENGFLTRCPDPAVTVGAAGALTGAYSYCGILKYTDKNGNITRSAPSNIVTPAAATADRYVIDMFSAPFGLKAKNCTVEIYRTAAGGSTFYLTIEVPVDMYSGADAWTSGTIIDNNTDAAIADNPILYTSGNILQNDPAPACKVVVQGGNRLFLVGLEDENELAYSKEKLFGESVSFSDFFRIRFDTAQYNTSGGLTAGGYMDDKLIAFKRNSIFYVAGQGPNETGAGNTFTEPELISAETGCTDPRSVVLTPSGLMFKGEKGIYLLNRGLATEFIGASVEQYKDYLITSAVHVDKKNLVVFSAKNPDVEEGVLLCYDYYTQQWSVIPDTFAIDGDVLNGELLFLNGDDNIPSTQSGSTFLDDASAYSMRVKTPWIKVSGVQDFGRIWSCTVLGKYKSAHDLTVKARYDYDEDYVETFNISPESTDDQYQYRCHLRKQKCEAVQFEIYDENATGEGMELTAITLEVGLRKGSMKIPAARKY